MQMPGLHIKSIHNPRPYTYAQIDGACAIGQRFGRGKLVMASRTPAARSIWLMTWST
jgi:hypothetical protein